MQIIKPLQAGIIYNTFTHRRRHYFVVSPLWGFKLDTGEPMLEPNVWEALSGMFQNGSLFDRGLPKERAEVLAYGSFHAPGGEPVEAGEVSLRLGPVEKRLAVFGDRRWLPAVGPSRPEPMVEMPITYKRAFGGEGYEANPVGRGVAKSDNGGEEGRWLPNVEYPNRLVGSPSDRPPPAAFETTDVTWAPRKDWAGTYDEEYLRTAMPGLPDDFDLRFFNDAPQDQWAPDYFTGTEPFEIRNMNPDHPVITGRLPGVRGRAFIRCREGAGPEFEEIQTRLDTVWFVPDANLGIVIYRGSREVTEDDATDLSHLMLAFEGVDQEPRSAEHYAGELERRADPVEGFKHMLNTAPLLPVGVRCALDQIIEDKPLVGDSLATRNIQTYSENQRAKAEEDLERRKDQFRKDLEAMGIPPETLDEQLNKKPEEPEEATRFKELQEKLLPRREDDPSRPDLTRVDLTALDEMREYADQLAAQRRAEMEQNLRDQLDQIRRESPDPAYDRGVAEAEAALAKFTQKPPLPRVDIGAMKEEVRSQSEAMAKQVKDMQALGVEFPQEDLEKMNIDPAMLEGQLTEAGEKAQQGYLQAANMMEEHSSPHPGQEPELAAALLGLKRTGGSAAGGDYAFCDLRDADLSGMDLSGAYLEYADLSGANLRGANLSNAILARAKLHGTRLTGANLAGANVGATDVLDADFSEADLTGATIGRARIRNSRFRHCRFGDRMDAFIEADLEGVDFSGAVMLKSNFIDQTLKNCVFVGADLSQSNILRCELPGCEFGGATLNGTNFVDAKAPGSRFDQAQMDNVRFVGEGDLAGCSFTRAVVSRANLRDNDLKGADFSGANMEMSDLGGADLREARFDGTNLVRAQFNKADLRQASLAGANLMEGSLFKAQLQSANFDGANCYAVNFMQATLGETSFLGANLDRSLLQDWRPSDG